MSLGRLGAALAACAVAAGCATASKQKEERPLVVADAKPAPKRGRALAPPPPPENVDPRPSDPRCGRQRIVGLKAIVSPGAFILLGDRYGSNEIPAFAGTMACEVAAGGTPVHLGLEIPTLDQPYVDRYLTSAGTPDDRMRLLGSGMWHRMYEDGRSSVALVDLIERVRALRVSGMPIEIHFYDSPFAKDLQPGTEKEKEVAQRLLDLRAKAPGDLYLVLTGNVHARTTPGVPWNAAFEPLGYHLAKAIPELVALDADYAGGKAWNCKLSPLGARIRCGERYVEVPAYRLRPADLPHAPDGTVPPWFVGLWQEPTPEGFHGIFHVGTLTPSPPANANEVQANQPTTRSR